MTEATKLMEITTKTEEKLKHSAMLVLSHVMHWTANSPYSPTVEAMVRSCQLETSVFDKAVQYLVDNNMAFVTGFQEVTAGVKVKRICVQPWVKITVIQDFSG